MSKLKLVLVTFVLSVIIVGIAVVIYKRYSLPVYKNASAALIATENALATPDTLVLASIDVDFLRKLESKLYGTAGLPDLKPDSTQNNSVYSVLQRAAMLQPDSIAYVSAAVYATKDKPASVALVAGGNIQTEAVINILKSSAQAQAHAQIENAWTVQVQDIDTCQMSKRMTVIVSRDRIIALDNDDLTLIKRLQSTAPAARDLSRWQDFRKSRFFAVAAFLPNELPQQGMDPFIGMAAQQAKQKLTDFEQIYLGAGSQAFPPGGSLALWMSARNPAIAADKAALWQAELAASRKDWEISIPTLAALHDRATIKARDNLLQAEVKLDKKLAEELGKLPAEVLGLIFSGFGMSAKTPQVASATPAEVLDKNPLKFTNQINLEQIPPYDPKATFAEPADISVGPLGLQLVGVRLTDANPRLLELEMKAMGTNLPNAGDNAESAMALSVSSVRDRDGKELLRAEPCGRERNALAAHPSFYSGSGILSASKKIRLQETARHADVASIQGSVKLSIPTRIENVAMINPKIGDHLEREGLRIEITKVETGAVSYRVSGKLERLLHLRAKNAKGENLSWGGAFSMGNPVSAGKSTTVEYKGKISSLEFVLAQTIEQKDFPFELKNIHPQAKDGWLLDKPLVYEAQKKADIKRDFAQQVVTPKRYQQPVFNTRVGPAMVDLGRVSTFRDMQLSFVLYMPLLKNLNGSLSAAELDIQKLTLADGSIHQPADGQAAWHVPVALSRNNIDDYLTGLAEVETGISGKGDKLNSISGMLWLNVPLAFDKATFPLTAVGAQLATSCGSMLITEISRKGVTLEGSGDPACLFAVRALNEEGKDMRTSNSSIKRLPQSWVLKISLYGLPNSLELIMAKKSERLAYPFSLTVSEGNAAR